jgi:hypothetical protein
MTLRNIATYLASTLFAGLLLVGTIPTATAFNLTGGLTGWWDQPDEQNHGLIIAISQFATGEQIGVAFWAHYDDEGRPTWLIAQGPLVGDTIEADLFEVDGINFMQPSGTMNGAEENVGTFAIKFDDCDSGLVTYASQLPRVGSGEFRISRLTTVPGMDCTGGITDNIPPSAQPESFDIELLPATGFANARGDAEWDARPGSAEFEVHIENVQHGTYDLFVAGEFRGEITASIDDGDDQAEGSIEFRSPQRRDYPLLDFDPSGANIEVFNSSGALVLSSVAPEPGTVADLGAAPPFGDEDILVTMTNAGVYPAGDAYAELEREPNVVIFEVDVEDIPVGQYSVRVDTIERGTLQVTADSDGDTDGELEFRYPATPGYALLDFDPRGALIEVVEGNTTLFSIDTFPGTAQNGDDDNPVDPGRGSDEGNGPELELVYEIPNRGVYAQADANAYFSRDEDGIEFEVEIEDVPVGTFTLKVGGQTRGTITTGIPSGEDNDGDFSAEGEIDFSNPQRSGESLLDFPVSGQLIEILEGETVIFSGTFPEF